MSEQEAVRLLLSLGYAVSKPTTTLPNVKAMARNRVSQAIAQGLLTRPDVCSKCGINPGRSAADGRTLVHAHHHDYSKPLEVEWLCHMCHRSETLYFCGESNPRSKLTAEDALEIRTSKLSRRALMQKFGVSAGCICDIRGRRTWANLR